MSLFDRIRAAAAEVSARARHVDLDDARLEVLAGRLVASVGEAADDPAHLHRGDDAATVAFVVTLDALNFGSGWFPDLRKEPGLSGYGTVARRLSEHFDRSGPFAAADLVGMDAGAVARLLRQPPDDPELAPLLSLFARSLRDLGSALVERHAGRFESLVRSAGGRAEALVSELARMPLYRDVARYGGLEVPFYKRAQITVADLARAFGGRGPGAFEDLDRLTLFADNLVPHVLRWEGVLVYDPELAARIDSGERLEAGEPGEVEIRAVALHAVEGLVARLAARGRPLRAHEIDTILWTRGQSPEMKARPRHRCRCPYY